MTLDVVFTENQDLLVAKVSGEYDMHEAIEKFPLVLQLCKKKDFSQVLIDFRELEGMATSTESLLYGVEIQNFFEIYKSEGNQPPRIAYLGKKNHPVDEEQGLEVAKLYELPIELFDSENEALAWLGGG